MISFLLKRLRLTTTYRRWKSKPNFFLFIFVFISCFLSNSDYFILHFPLVQKMERTNPVAVQLLDEVAQTSLGELSQLPTGVLNSMLNYHRVEGLHATHVALVHHDRAITYAAAKRYSRTIFLQLMNTNENLVCPHGSSRSDPSSHCQSRSSVVNTFANSQDKYAT